MKKSVKETTKEEKTKKVAVKQDEQKVTKTEKGKTKDKNLDAKKKTSPKKKESKKEKKNIFNRLWDFLKDVKKEMKKVHFPNRKEMVKYSIATLGFILFFSLFFYVIDVIFALIRSMV